MKRSNKVLVLLAIILLAGVFATDHSLAVNYKKIDLNDPYKNFSDVPVKPFKQIHITGGNSYFIRIREGKEFNIKLLNSRASFFKMSQHSDTLNIRFGVANRSPGQPFEPVLGIIITTPSVSYFELAGVHTEIENFKQDSIVIKHHNSSITRIKNLQTNFLKLTGDGISMFDFQKANKTDLLEIDLSNRTSLFMNGIEFRKFIPVLRDSAAIVINPMSLDVLKKSGVSSN